jgi:RNA polymerase sigma-70 factor, ECF subfamily
VNALLTKIARQEDPDSRVTQDIGAMLPPPGPTDSARHNRRGSCNKGASKIEPGHLASNMSDEELVTRLKGGEIAAFDLLVKRHRHRIYRLALTLMRNEHDAEEVVQDAFMRAFVGLHGFRGTSSFYTWLYRIVVNLAIDARRRVFRQRIDWETIAERADDTRAFELPRIHSADPYEAVVHMELRRSTCAAFSELTAYHRKAIVMRELEGMSYQEISERLHISKGTVMSRLFHARRRLQKGLLAQIGS